MKTQLETMTSYVATGQLLKEETAKDTLDLFTCHLLLGHLMAFEIVLDIPKEEKLSKEFGGLIHLKAGAVNVQ